MVPIEALIRAHSHLHRTCSVTVIQRHKDSIETQVSLSHRLEKKGTTIPLPGEQG